MKTRPCSDARPFFLGQRRERYETLYETCPISSVFAPGLQPLPARFPRHLAPTQAKWLLKGAAPRLRGSNHPEDPARRRTRVRSRSKLFSALQSLGVPGTTTNNPPRPGGRKIPCFLPLRNIQSCCTYRRTSLSMSFEHEYLMLRPRLTTGHTAPGTSQGTSRSVRRLPALQPQGSGDCSRSQLPPPGSGRSGPRDPP